MKEQKGAMAHGTLPGMKELIEREASNLISISVMIKSGGYKVVKIPPNMLGSLAAAIYREGSEWITLQNGPIQVVGLMVTGDQTGDRVIILNEKSTEETNALSS